MYREPKIKKSRAPKKKTDLPPWEKQQQQRQNRRLAKQKVKGSELVQGRVLAVLPTSVQVQSDHELLHCSLRGVLKKERLHQSSLLVAGDLVQIRRLSAGVGVIEAIEKRHSLLSAACGKSKKEKLIAANIDLVLITATICHPQLQLDLIDRSLIAAKKGAMQPVIVINKMDLISPMSSEEKLLKKLFELYQSLHIEIMAVSAKKGAHIDRLQQLMKGKSSVFVGASGVGKSSLINAVAKTELVTSELSLKTLKGVHTTTRASLIQLDSGGWCIDTPGIQYLGLWQMQATDLKAYFQEFAPFAPACRFPNCTHHHEPACAVQKALKEGLIHPLRYQSYLSLIKHIS